MARGGLEPPTPRFSVVGQPALTRCAEGSKTPSFALLRAFYEEPPAPLGHRAPGRDTGGFRWVCAAMRGRRHKPQGRLLPTGIALQRLRGAADLGQRGHPAGSPHLSFLGRNEALNGVEQCRGSLGSRLCLWWLGGEYSERGRPAADRPDGSCVDSQTLGQVVDVDLLLGGDPCGDDCRQQAGGEFHRMADGVLADGDRDPAVNVRAGLKAGFSECVRQPATHVRLGAESRERLVDPPADCSDAGVAGHSPNHRAGTAEPIMSASRNAATPPGRRWDAALRTASAGSAWYISTNRPTKASNGPPSSCTSRKSPHTNSTLPSPASSARGRDCLLVTLDPYHRPLGTHQASDRRKLTSPGPQPTSRTRIPAAIPARSSRRRVNGSCAADWRPSRWCSSLLEELSAYPGSTMTRGCRRVRPFPSGLDLVVEVGGVLEVGPEREPGDLIAAGRVGGRSWSPTPSPYPAASAAAASPRLQCSISTS